MNQRTKKLELKLLGSPLVLIESTPITGFITSKAEALLYYLAITARTHTRSALAALFWPDVPESVARKNLRDIIFNLRKLLGDYLIITRQTIALNEQLSCWVDATALRDIIQRPNDAINYLQLRDTITLYQGDLLEGFYVRDAEAFDEWLMAEREQLRVAVIQSMHRLVAYYLETSAWNEGLHLTQQLLAMDSWDEAAHRQQMRLLAVSGQRGAALVQYERCYQILTSEFGVEPSAETQALYQAIHAGELPRPLSSSTTGNLYPLYQANDRQGSNGEIRHTQFFQRDTYAIPQPAFFVGRQTELKALDHAIFHEQKRLIAVVGLGGQGKTALVGHFVARLYQRNFSHGNNRANGHGHLPFQRVLWYSCQNTPSLSEILSHWLQQLALPLPVGEIARTEQLLTSLFTYLHDEPVLFILDNFESFLSAEKKAGAYRKESLEIEHLLDRFAASTHRGVLMLTSREQPLTFARLADNRTIKMLPLEGITPAEAIQLLQHCELAGTEEEFATLATRYSGNPLALKIVAETINELFTGDLPTFLQEETLFVDDIRQVLDQQFARLSAIEIDILLWLAIEREAVTPQQIWDNLIPPPPRNHFYEALRSLQRRFLIETNEYPKRFTGQLAVHLSMQTVVLEYVTEYFVSAMCQELMTETLEQFHRFLLLKAQAPDYIRQRQKQTFVKPLLRRLRAKWGEKWIEPRLQVFLSQLKTHTEQTPGYAAANLLHLMIEAGIDLTAKDFSHLAIWQADLRNVSLRNMDFSHTDLKNTVFAEYFGSVTAVAFSPNQQLLAVGTSDGNVLLWRMVDGQLAGICRGNGRWVWTIAFSPNGQILACGYADKAIRLWEVSDIYAVETSQLRAAFLQKTLIGHEDAIFAVAFSPDGVYLASGSGDGMIYLWQVSDGTIHQRLPGHHAGILTLAFNAAPQRNAKEPLWQLASGGRDRVIHIWPITHTVTAPIASSQQMIGHTDEIYSVAFHPEGAYLISGSGDHTVRLWSLTTGATEHIFTDATDAILTVACSQDTIVAAGNDHLIYRWQLQSGQRLLPFSGHIGAVGAVAITKDGQTLASGSFDQSLRLWDLRQGQSIRTYYSKRNGVRATALHPAEILFVNGGHDGTLALWHTYRQRTAPSHTILHTPRIALEPVVATNPHCGMFYGLAFHPQNAYLVSVSEDGFIRFWTTANTIQCVEKIPGGIGALIALAISPDGEWLAAGSANAKIVLYSLSRRRITHILVTTTPLVEALLFSPDSQWLYSASEKNDVLIWQTAALPQDEFAVTSVATPHRRLSTTTNGVLALAVHPQGAYLAVGGANPGVELWALPEGKLTQSYPTLSSTFAITFSPDGKLLAAGGGGNLISLWDYTTGEKLALLEGHKATVRRLHFAANGTLLFSGGDDETIILWQQVESQWQHVEKRRSPGPYEGLNIYGATGINGEQHATLSALGAVEEVPVTPTKRQIHNLPTPLTPLYGRDEDVERLLEELLTAECRLLTILGEGGIGKTRVALEVARKLVGLAPNGRGPGQLAHSFDDGVWFISLAAIPDSERSPEQFISIIGSVLNLSFSHHSALGEQLTNQLQSRKLLLILDNFEHLRPDAIDFLSKLLYSAPHLKVIVTSRHHLDLFAQHVHRLQGLPIPTGATDDLSNEALLQYPAIRLFVEQAKRVTGSFTLATANRSAVLWLCRFMHGLPLGIQLAAAQLVNYSIEEVVERAQRDLSLLVSSAADLPKHQRSLQTLLQSSWEDLAPHLAKLLTYCSIFEDSFSSEAAVAIADVSPNALDELVHRSLLHSIQDGRYLIHEFVRTFVHSQPQNGANITLARQQHAIYFAQLLDTIGRRKQSSIENFQVLSQNLADLCAAWTWMLEQCQLAYLRQSIEGFVYFHERLGQLAEASHLICEAIARVETYITTLHTSAQETAGSGNPVDSALALAEETLADLHIFYAMLREMMGDLAQTYQSAQIVFAYGKTLNIPRLEAHGAYLLALQAQQLGQLNNAMEWVQQATKITIEQGLSTLQITTQNLQGIIHDMQGDHHAAVACYKTALSLAIATQDLFQERLLVNNLGIVALATGEWEAAKVYLERNLNLSERAGNLTKHTYALMNHALYLSAVGLYEEARQELLQGLSIARTTQHRQSEIYILQFLSLTNFYGGRSQSGLKFAEEALALVEEYHYSGLKAATLAVLGHNYLALDQMEKAHELYEESISLWRAMSNHLEVGTVLIANAYTLLRLGRLTEALRYTEATMQMLDAILAENAMEAMWVIIGCFFVLQEANDDRRYAVLQRGSQQLLRQAETLRDPAVHKAFLNNVYPHRLIMRAIGSSRP